MELETEALRLKACILYSLLLHRVAICRASMGHHPGHRLVSRGFTGKRLDCTHTMASFYPVDNDTRLMPSPLPEKADGSRKEIQAEVDR